MYIKCSLSNNNDIFLHFLRKDIEFENGWENEKKH